MASLVNVATIIDIVKCNNVVARPVKHCVALLLAELFPWGINIKPVVLSQRRQHMKVVYVAFIPAAYRAL